jgi:hypothetical protein
MTRYLLGATVSGLIGALCLTVSVLDRRFALAQRDLIALDYGRAEQTLSQIERYVELASRAPGISRAPLNDIRARKAALQYWRRDYGGLVPAVADPVASLPPDNVGLQFVVANAVYRAGQERARDPRASLQAIDAGLIAYLGVLKNSERHEKAAFNYEYLVRLRNAIGGGGRRPSGGGAGSEESSPHGQAGKPPKDSDMSKFKIHVPLESQELDQQKEGEKAGKTATRARKG